MSRKRPDSEFAWELLSDRKKRPATANSTPYAGLNSTPIDDTVNWPFPAMTEGQFDGTETVVVEGEPAGVPKLDDLRRLSKEIRQAAWWGKK